MGWEKPMERIVLSCQGYSVSHRTAEYPQPGNMAITQFFTFLVVHLGSQIFSWNLKVQPIINCAQTLLWDWIHSLYKAAKNTEGPQHACSFTQHLELVLLPVTSERVSRHSLYLPSWSGRSPPFRWQCFWPLGLDLDLERPTAFPLSP